MFVCRVYVLLLERKNKADGFVVHDVVKKAESLVLGPHGSKQIVLLVSNEYWKTSAPFSCELLCESHVVGPRHVTD